MAPSDKTAALRFDASVVEEFRPVNEISSDRAAAERRDPLPLRVVETQVAAGQELRRRDDLARMEAEVLDDVEGRGEAGDRAALDRVLAGERRRCQPFDDLAGPLDGR